MEPTDRLQVAGALAGAARALTSQDAHGAAFAAAILSRIATAESLLTDDTKLAIDANALRFTTQFLTYSAALKEFTTALSRQLSTASLSVEFMQDIEELDLVDLPLNLDDQGSSPGSATVFRKLARRMADDGMPAEAGRALSSATVAAWHEAHLAKYPESWWPLLTVVLNVLSNEAMATLEHAGPTAVWNRLQEIKFVPEPTPTALP